MAWEVLDFVGVGFGSVREIVARDVLFVHLGFHNVGMVCNGINEMRRLVNITFGH
jgi:hypothetical protein